MMYPLPNRHLFSYKWRTKNEFLRRYSSEPHHWNISRERFTLKISTSATSRVEGPLRAVTTAQRHVPCLLPWDLWGCISGVFDRTSRWKPRLGQWTPEHLFYYSVSPAPELSSSDDTSSHFCGNHVCRQAAVHSLATDALTYSDCIELERFFWTNRQAIQHGDPWDKQDSAGLSVR